MVSVHGHLTPLFQERGERRQRKNGQDKIPFKSRPSVNYFL
jgi:hypothetical protein